MEIADFFSRISSIGMVIVVPTMGSRLTLGMGSQVASVILIGMDVRIRHGRQMEQPLSIGRRS
jgi:hypothetical protein